MHMTPAGLIMLFIVLTDGILILKFTVDLNRLRQAFPRPEGFEQRERALKIVRLTMGASLVTVPAVVWVTALTAAPELLRPLF